MKTRILSLVLILTLLFVCGVASFADGYVPNEVLVQLQPGVSITAFNAAYNTTTLASGSNNTYCLGTASNVDDVALATTMSADTTRVISAEPNQAPNSQFIFSADGIDPQTGQPIQTSQFIFGADADQDKSTQFIFGADADQNPSTQFIFGADQFIFGADQFIFGADRNPGLYAYVTQPTSSLIHYGATAKHYNGAGVLVAVLDTGVSTRNPLLALHVTKGWNFVNGNSNTDDSPSGIDSNGNGIADEDAGHGTMVAGLINRYAQGATILPVKVLNSDGAGNLLNIVQGIRYAVSKGAKVINMSVGTPKNSPLLRNAIKDAWAAGVIVITAAGNDNTFNKQFPAGDNITIAVGSLDANNVKASFSNYGAWVDVVAPGVGLPSTFWNGGYAAWSGTSFSAPLVTAEAALIISARPNWTATKVRARIKNQADSVDLLNLPYTGLLGAGIIDMDQALSFGN
ncbi:MAG: Subtilase family [Chthonomonadales bacterium]|nr:Subtilase family [Chthonomonadales bacterium]